MLLSTAVVVYASRDALAHPLLARAATWYARREWNAELSIERVRGNWFTGLRAEGLRLRAPDRPLGGIRSLDAEVLEVGHSWGRVRTITGSGIRAVLDLRAPSAGGPAGERAALPASLPDVDLDRVDLELFLPSGWELSASDLRLTVRADAGAHRVAASSSDLVVTGESEQFVAGALDAAVRYDRGRIAVERFGLGAHAIDPGSKIDLSGLHEDRAAWDGRVVLVDPGPLEGRIAVASSAELPLDDPAGIRGTASLSASALAYRGREIAELAGEVHAADGEVRIPRLSASTAGGRLDLFECALPLRGAGPLPTSGSFELETIDLPRDLLGRTGQPDVPHRLFLSGAFAGDRAAVEEGLLEVADGRAVVQSGWFEAGPTPSYELEARADFPDLAPLGELLDHEPWAGSVQGGLRVRGGAEELHVEAELSGGGVLVAGVPLGAVELEASADLPVARPADVQGSAGFRFGPAELGGVPLAEVRGALRVDAAAVFATELVLTQPKNRVELADLRLPRSLDVAELLAGATGAFRAEIDDLPAALGRSRLSERWKVPEHRLVASGALGGGGATIVEGELRTEGGTARFLEGDVATFEDGSGARRISVNGALATAFDDLSPLGPILGTRPWEGALNGDVRLFGEWPDVTVTLDLSGSGVVAAGIPLGDVVAVAEVGREVVRASRLELANGADRLSASGVFRPPDLAFEDVVLEANVADLGRYLPAFAERGAVRAEGRAAGVFPTLTGELVVHAEDLVVRGLPLERIELDARAEDGSYAITSLHVTGPHGGLTAAGRAEALSATGLDAWRASFDRLVLARGDHSLELSEPFEVEAGPARLVTSELRLEGPSGLLYAAVDLQGETIRARATAVGLDLEALPFELLPEGFELRDLEGELDLRRDGTGSSLRSRGSIGTLRSGDAFPTAAAEWSVRLDGGRLEVEWLSATAEDGSSLILTGTAPLAPFGEELFPEGAVDLHLDVALSDLTAFPAVRAPDGAPIEGGLRLDALFGGGWRALEGEIAIEGARLRTAALDRPGELRARLVVGDGIRIEEAAIEIPERLRIAAVGLLAVPTDPVAWLGSAELPPAGSELDLDCSLDASDLAWLAPRVRTVRRIGGTASGRVSVKGRLREPELVGELRLREADVKLASEFPALSAVDLDLLLEGRRIVIERVVGELGGSPFEIAGTVSLEDSRAIYDVRLTGKNLLLRRERGILVRADADVTLTGPLASLLAKGDLRLRRPRITRDIDLFGLGSERLPSSSERGIQLFSFAQPPLSTMTLDLLVTTEEPVSIRNNLVRGAARPDLRIAGTGEVPRVEGTVYVEPTQVSLPASRVRFEAGTITFLEARPFVPEVQLAGSARKLGYDCSVSISGPYDAPEVQLSSVPPLPAESIALLLLTGQPPEQAFSGASAFQATQTVAIFLAEDVVADWLAGSSFDDDDESLVDRLEIMTGRDVSKEGVPTAEVTFRLKEGLFEEKDRLLLSWERDPYEHYNLGLRLVFRLR